MAPCRGAFAHEGRRRRDAQGGEGCRRTLGESRRRARAGPRGDPAGAGVRPPRRRQAGPAPRARGVRLCHGARRYSRLAGRLCPRGDGECGGGEWRALAAQDPLPARQVAPQRAHRRRRARAVRSHLQHRPRTRPMSSRVWSAVDRYITETPGQPDAALEAALGASDAAGLPQISVSPAHGKLLWLLARLVNARRILEIGTLGRYTTIWLAPGLAAGGRLISLEAVEKHATVARANIERAGLSRIVEVRVGKALDTLPSVEGPIDLSFIDADKQNNPEYFRWALKLSRPGSVIVVDNAMRDGKEIDAGWREASVLGVRKLNQLVAGGKRGSAAAIQTGGIKGADGFAVALVLE